MIIIKNNEKYTKTSEINQKRIAKQRLKNTAKIRANCEKYLEAFDATNDFCATFTDKNISQYYGANLSLVKKDDKKHKFEESENKDAFYIFDNGQLSFFNANDKEFAKKVSDDVVFEFLLQKVLNNNIIRGNNKITFKIKEYQEIRKLKDYKSAKNQLFHGCKMAKITNFEFSDNKKGIEYSMMSFISEFTALTNGKINITFSELYLDYLHQSTFKAYSNSRVFELDINKYPHSFYFNKALVNWYRMNHHKNTLECEHIIPIKVLVKSAPLLNYDNKHFSFFENQISSNLNHLQEMNFIYWEYCDKQGDAIDTKLLEKYDSYIELYILVKILGYPDIIKLNEKT